MIAILGAIDGEIKEFLDHIGRSEKSNWNDFTFYKGRLANHDVVISLSGVGKVMAAMVTQKIIDLYEPEALIMTGLAGALNPELEIGDTVIGRDCIQHDLDASVFGFERGQVPYSPYRIIESDEKLHDIAVTCKPETGRLFVGRILTGDQFLTKSYLRGHKYLIDELQGDAVEMEGAAAGLVATVNKVPFLIIRTISDKIDKQSMVDFKRFLPKASKNSFLIVRHILERLG